MTRLHAARAGETPEVFSLDAQTARDTTRKTKAPNDDRLTTDPEPQQIRGTGCRNTRPRLLAASRWRIYWRTLGRPLIPQLMQAHILGLARWRVGRNCDTLPPMASRANESRGGPSPTRSTRAPNSTPSTRSTPPTSTPQEAQSHSRRLRPPFPRLPALRLLPLALNLSDSHSERPARRVVDLEPRRTNVMLIFAPPIENGLRLVRSLERRQRAPSSPKIVRPRLA